MLGLNLTEPSLAHLLPPQDCLYSRTLRHDACAETRIIGALRDVIDVKDDASSEATIGALGGSEISAVTITVTEKGYCLTPSTGALDFKNPAFRADLEGGFSLRTLLGLLALALERRRQNGAAPLILINCYNVPSNGAWLGAAMLEFAVLRSPALTRWIEDRITFPCTMVDRIVPATTPDDIGRPRAHSRATRLRSSASRSSNGSSRISSPASGRLWTSPGPSSSPNSKPCEQIKMRVLNAAQSMLAHQGALVGHEFTYQATADPVLAALTRRMLERETSATLPKLTGMEAGAYVNSSMARIRNAVIRDRCHQIGADGSQKIVPASHRSFARTLSRRPADLLTFAVASRIAYGLRGARRFGARWTSSDPYVDTVIAMGEKISDWGGSHQSGIGCFRCSARRSRRIADRKRIQSAGPVSKAYVEVIEESFSVFKSLSTTLAVAMALVLRVEQRSSRTRPRCAERRRFGRGPTNARA